MACVSTHAHMFSVFVGFLALCTNCYSHSIQGLMAVDACAVPAQTLAGSVCGAIRTSYSGALYASFRGMPYARQPMGELRFVAPQPLEPWDGFYNATAEGPVCLQHDFLYGPMLRPRSMGEDCLRANVHVPAPALPQFGSECCGSGCLPVLVFVHGGGFDVGSGDSDMNGPEYMVEQNVVVVTFNYRLGPFGFLSLNSSSVPGNTGLRDMVAALQWVRDNVRAFGGDPGRVSLMGQSAGGAAVHILSMSEAARGLFTKVIMMSGTAVSGFLSTTAKYAQFLTSALLKHLRINSTDPEEIHRKLIQLPYEAILQANDKVRKSLGLAAFNPIVESQFDGVTRILDEDPNVLVAKGRGGDYPLLIGFTNVECASLRRTLEELDIVAKIKKNATGILPVKLLFSLSDGDRDAATEQMSRRYFNGTPTLDKFIVSCSESTHIYPTIKLVQIRASTDTAPVFMYQFSYSSAFTPPKQAFRLNYKGAGHLDDLSYVLRVNSILQNTTLNSSDQEVKDWMINIVGNFIRCSSPTCSAAGAAWPRAARALRYQNVTGATYSVTGLSAHQRSMLRLFDRFHGL